MISFQLLGTSQATYSSSGLYDTKQQPMLPLVGQLAELLQTLTAVRVHSKKGDVANCLQSAALVKCGKAALWQQKPSQIESKGCLEMAGQQERDWFGMSAFCFASFVTAMTKCM